LNIVRVKIGFSWVKMRLSGWLRTQLFEDYY